MTTGRYKRARDGGAGVCGLLSKIQVENCSLYDNTVEYQELIIILDRSEFSLLR